jgi:cytochrome c oxidase cbb3-type subunit 4
MFSDFLSAIDGVDKYPIITLILFGCVFLGVLIYIVTMNKDKVKQFALIPLNDNEKIEECENEKNI